VWVRKGDSERCEDPTNGCLENGPLVAQRLYCQESASLQVWCDVYNQPITVPHEQLHMCHNTPRHLAIRRFQPCRVFSFKITFTPTPHRSIYLTDLLHLQLFNHLTSANDHDECHYTCDSRRPRLDQATSLSDCVSCRQWCRFVHSCCAYCSFLQCDGV
jgi:hypothetical protein